MLILNDIHIGMQRKGGTTLASQETLRSYLLTSFEAALVNSTETHLLILGDLFDEFEVDPRDWLATYRILSNWLDAGKELTLVAGNHDWSPKGNKVSSFEMLCDVLGSQFPAMFHRVGIDSWIARGTYAVVAHCSNQDIFNTKLDELLGGVSSGTRVLLHANYDNNFAAQSDHSLNVSRQQAAAFINKGATLYFAHEHQARIAQGGSVVVFGNQWPTSVSDCLENDAKYAHVMTGGVSKMCTWSRDDEFGFLEVDWRSLAEVLPRGFYRVTGTASSNEASEVINAIAKFRQMSDAFVITNAVKVDGVAEVESLPESFEAARSFDILEYIETNLTGEEFVVVKSLMEEQS